MPAVQTVLAGTVNGQFIRMGLHTGVGPCSGLFKHLDASPHHSRTAVMVHRPVSGSGQGQLKSRPRGARKTPAVRSFESN